MNKSLLQQFKDYYQDFDQQPLDGLEVLYSDDVVFTDPIHTIQGLAKLKAYFNSMCSNLTACRFEFIDDVISDDRATFNWVMHYRHPSIANNKPLSLRGISYIKFNGKVTHHEDFYDMGAMLYEHLPILGRATRYIKTKAAGTH